MLFISCTKEEEIPINLSPSCTITNPVDGQGIIQGDTVIICVEASDSDGEISNILFLIDGIEKSSSTEVSYTWMTSDVSIGLHTIKCTVYDNEGRISSDEIEIEIIESLFFTDVRDGQVYGKLFYGNKTWMAENLNYTSPIYVSYLNIEAYGRLYKWEGAMNVCPAGWHLPTDNEWKLLELELGMTLEEVELEDFRGTDQGKMLKSTTGWYENMEGFNSSGFSGFAAGSKSVSNGQFYGEGIFASWWTASEEDSVNAWNRWLTIDSTQVSRNAYGKEHSYSVRCVKD